MKYLAVSKHFQKQLKKLPNKDREKAIRALKVFITSLRTRKIPSGYRFKKINGDKYEIRVSIKIRIVLKQDGDTLVCHVVGNHETVRRYLRTFR